MDPVFQNHIDETKKYIKQLNLAREIILQKKQWIELLTQDLIHLDSIEDLSLRAERRVLIIKIQKILDEIDI
jgi:hypothetical protein